jgi:PPOX class probable F420-dependent enzyme
VTRDAESLLDGVRAYLAAPRCAVLTTIGADGGPHPAVVHYLLDEDTLMVNGRADRRWVTNARRNPSVSLVVHDADDPQHWVGLKGDATVIRDGAAAVEDAMTLARRYGEDASVYGRQQRVSFEIVPRNVFEYVA